MVALIGAILLLVLILVFYYLRTRAPAPPSLYDRLGGVYAIAAVVDHFSDALLRNPVVGKASPNPALRNWSVTQSPTRLAGLKFMRTLWVCDVAGGPFRFHPSAPSKCPFAAAQRTALNSPHDALHISPAEFDAVASELAASLDHFAVPAAEKNEVLAAFLARKGQVTQGCSVPTAGAGGA